VSATISGTDGRIRIVNPLAPHVWHRLTVSTTTATRRERVAAARPTATSSTRSSRRWSAVSPFPTTVEDATANMRVIDAAYRCAGLEPRHGTVA
jgi:hypothetical protein